ncbi:hypothetical protein C4D60_Mb11t03050 [Musa balbisiana]|uniref:Uncharacterized protein n=1 Tax=Musa balbisiana TaxID=52838 RepID=A0A4S8J1C9_MUSBA|nr:hypothetical protein C4D60_Mb11t03050 [Musa balbisiana]
MSGVAMDLKEQGKRPSPTAHRCQLCICFSLDALRHISSSGLSEEKNGGSSANQVRSGLGAVMASEARHSRAASCGLDADDDGDSSLQSAKYFPDTPSNRGCVAT